MMPRSISADHMGKIFGARVWKGSPKGFRSSSPEQARKEPYRGEWIGFSNVAKWYR
jgi:hypothetical protein